MNTYRKNAVMAGVLYHPGDGLWDFGRSHWRRSVYLAHFQQTACRCGYAKPRCRQFVPAYRGGTFYHHDGDFAGGDDDFPLPDL